MSVLTLCQPWGNSVLVTDILNNEKSITFILDYIKEDDFSEFRLHNGLKIIVSAIQLSDGQVDPPLIVNLLCKQVGYFAQVLIELSQNFSCGQNGKQKPFGFARLGILELFLSLMCTEFPVVVNEMVSNGIFSILMDLFFEYKWNNIVHHQITKMFVSLLYCNNDQVPIVVEKCNIIDRIVEAHLENSQITCGFLGHLRELANELIYVSSYYPQITALMAKNEAWQNFVQNELERYNELEGNVQIMPDSDGSDDDVDLVVCDVDDYGDYEEYEIDVDDY